MAAIVSEYCDQVNAKMQDVLCYSATDIDGRFSILRSAESSAANLILDIFRLETGADIAFMVGVWLGGRWGSGLASPPAPPCLLEQRCCP